jgi:hypothetical protein
VFLSVGVSGINEFGNKYLACSREERTVIIRNIPQWKHTLNRYQGIICMGHLFRVTCKLNAACRVMLGNNVPGCITRLSISTNCPRLAIPPYKKEPSKCWNLAINSVSFQGSILVRASVLLFFSRLSGSLPDLSRMAMSLQAHLNAPRHCLKNDTFQRISMTDL